jgi:hypothetical protein
MAALKTTGSVPSARAARTRRLTAQARENNKALRKQVAEAEAELKRLWQKRSGIDEMLARPNSNTSGSELMKS